MKREVQLSLIDALLDGSISEADRLRIEAELIVDPEVRSEYYQRVQLSVLLQQEAETVSATSEFNRVHLSTKIAPARFSGGIKLLAGSLIALAASILILFVFNRGSFPFGQDLAATIDPSSNNVESKTELSASGFAVVIGQENVAWSGATFSDGDLLPAGEIHLTSGLAHLELFSGVQVVVEGESRFTIDSPMQITMTQGVARAHVPEPAQGFRIKTTSGDVVDLGTEFVVNVDEDGADVHVLDGEVELHPPANEMLHLDAGASRRLAESGGVIDAHSNPTGTVGPTEFQDRLLRKQQERFSEWSSWRDITASHPHLVAHYRFHSDRPQSRRIENLAKDSPTQASDGTIVAARRGADRWNRSDGAVDFSPIGSRVRVEIPGELDGLTMLCWVKINSLDRWYNSLFLTDGHEDREPHWQWMDDGRIFFSVKVPSQAGKSKASQPIFYSPEIWTPSLSGRWIMLAVTYDVKRKEVTHYFNGKPVSSEAIPDHALVEAIRIGRASICNWSEPMYRTDPEFVLRNLNGTMDEFAIYSAALTADEIMHWYDSGNPNE